MVTVMAQAFAQTYNTRFLDGSIMFKMNDPVSHAKAKQLDPNTTSLKLSLADYPKLAQIFKDAEVTKLELPSYFSGKKELMNVFRIRFNKFDQVDKLVRDLQALGHMTFVEKEPIYYTDFIPNDTYHTGTSKWYHTLVGSEQAWDISQGSNSIKVAIVDNAVFSNHQDLTTYLQRDVADNDNDATPPTYYNSDQGWSHGTHCAGLATADINNAKGIASLGANVELIGVKATPNSATSSASIWYGYDGVQWACANGANVVSMSYGGPDPSAAMQTLVDAYTNVVFLAAAGNDGATTPMYPGALNNVICVGSVNSTDARSSFSNYNGATPFVDIASPGGYSFGGLYSSVYTSMGNGYAQMGGTSMATPFAAGLVGLMLSINPAMTRDEILNCLLTTGAVINQNIGPRIDAYAAVQCVQATLTGDPIPYFSGTPLTIIEGDYVNFLDQSADGGNAITTWEWTFPGGTPSSFTGQVPPAIQYNAAGTYDVTLTVTNSQSQQSLTQTGYVNVGVQPYGEWIEQASAFATASTGITDISIVDANVVWAIGYDGTGGGANVQKFTKTSNGGTNWASGNINVGNTGLGIAMIHGFDISTAWIAVYPRAGGQTGGIWKTVNGGTNWTRQTTATFNNAASFTNVVHFWDANVGFCQGDPINGDFELYTTTNGGTNWTLVPGANIPNPLNGNEFGYVGQIEVVGDNVWFTTSLGRIYHSTDRGLNWNVYQSPISDFGGAIVSTMSGSLSFSDANNGIIIDINGVVYRTTNGGANWTTVTTSGPVFTNSVCYIEGTDVVFSTGAATGNSGSSYSTDGGTNWNLIDTEQHLDVEFLNPSIGWSGWFNQDATTKGMWKWNNLSSPLQGEFSTGTTNACTFADVTFTDETTGGTPNTWSWNFPGGTPSTSSLETPTVTYASPGTYDVSLTVGDGINFTTVTKTAYVTAVNPPAQPSAITGLTPLCEGASQVYSVVNTAGVVYSWTVPATWTGSSATNTINLTAGSAGGTLSVSAENVCGLSPASDLIVDVTPLPVASFTSAVNGVTYDFTSTSANATGWTWDFGDGNGDNIENPSHTYIANGNYDVVLTVTNACGTDQTTSPVIISTVGLDDLTANNLKIYPVPATSVITIQLTEEMLGGQFTIVDAKGRIVATEDIDAVNMVHDLKGMDSGVYYVQFTNSPEVLKFVKK